MNRVIEILEDAFDCLAEAILECDQTESCDDISDKIMEIRKDIERLMSEIQ